MPWIKRTLRGNEVFVKANSGGQPDLDARKRVEIRYKLSPGAKAYHAYAANLEPTGDPADERPFEAAGLDLPNTGSAPPLEKDAIIIYTDGACTGNPGPMGIGVVISDGAQRRELSEFLGEGTNNIAELTAIARALEAISPGDRNRPIVLHTDSGYSLGLLTKGWKPKANTELVAYLRRLAAQFPRLRFVKVKGHAGVPENERCDVLGRRAIATRKSTSA